LFGAKVENNQEFSKFEGLEHKKTLPKLQAVRAKTLAKSNSYLLQRNY